MPIDRCARAPRHVLTVLAAMLLSAVVATASGRVQVTVDTEIRSISFNGVEGVPERDLRAVLQTRSRGAVHGLRAALGKLPLIPSPTRHVFAPLVLAEDVVRMRRVYRRAGFLDAQIRYDLVQVGDKDLYDLVFTVDESAQERLIEVTVVASDSLAPLPVPPEEQDDWARTEAGARKLAGHRLDTRAAIASRRKLTDWWRNRGFPSAEVRGRIERDTLRGEGRITFAVTPGPRRRLGAITIQGNQAIDDGVVLRELPFHTGDVYSDEALAEGRRDLQELAVVRSARIQVAPPVAADAAADVDSVVPVVVTITEGKQRQISGQVGYVTDAGVSVETGWSHFNFTGGARVLTASGLSQTGWLATVDRPDIRHRGSVSLHQPFVFHRGYSGIVSPFVEYREDSRDRSLQTGSNFTLVYRGTPGFSGSLDYQIAKRRIYEYRLEELAAGDVDIFTFLAQLAAGEVDSSGTDLRSSLVTLVFTAQNLDNIAGPRRGVFVRPSLQVTAPTGMSSASYWRADCTAHVFAPLARRVTFAGRVTAGRLFPFGKSLPGPDLSPSTAKLRLYDAGYTAGGSTDVRGWGHRELGPKFPDIRFVQQGDTLATRTDGYVPLGGFSRVSFTLELRLPLPAFGERFGSHVFLDGGRVWTGDERFGGSDDPFDQERFFYATGAGLDFLTPVGSIRLSLAYKLNPSPVDLAESQAILDALIAEAPIDAIERHDSRRWQLNFAIGASY